jgi:hypothetical protein
MICRRRFHCTVEPALLCLHPGDGVCRWTLYTLEIRAIARKIVARYPRPDFYRTYSSEARDSLQFFQSDTAIVKLHRDMAECLDDDFGHGMGHVEKVAVDAGTLIIIESRLAGLAEDLARRNLLLAQCAGLLHDICRKEKSHADKGAAKARDILKPIHWFPKKSAMSARRFATTKRLPV